MWGVYHVKPYFIQWFPTTLLTFQINICGNTRDNHTQMWIFSGLFNVRFHSEATIIRKSSFYSPLSVQTDLGKIQKEQSQYGHLHWSRHFHRDRSLNNIYYSNPEKTVHSTYAKIYYFYHLTHPGSLIIMFWTFWDPLTLRTQLLVTE